MRYTLGSRPTIGSAAVNSMTQTQGSSAMATAELEESSRAWTGLSFVAAGMPSLRARALPGAGLPSDTAALRRRGAWGLRMRLDAVRMTSANRIRFCQPGGRALYCTGEYCKSNTGALVGV